MFQHVVRTLKLRLKMDSLRGEYWCCRCASLSKAALVHALRLLPRNRVSCLFRVIVDTESRHTVLCQSPPISVYSPVGRFE
jgi:hypothetical protein